MSEAEPGGIVTVEAERGYGVKPMARPWAVMASSVGQRDRGTALAE